MAQSAWTPSFDQDAFDQCMENAFRRVSGTVGTDISKDRGNTRLLKERASQAVKSTLGSRGPSFLRLGKGALELAAYRAAGTMDLQQCTGDILREFFDEGSAAYRTAKIAFHQEALTYLQSNGLGATESADIVKEADAGFALPEKDDFSLIGQPFCQGNIAPSTLAAMGGGAVFLACILLVRSPILAGGAAILTTGAAYYFARSHHRNKGFAIIQNLPAKLYEKLLQDLHSNTRRYGETVSAAVAARMGS